MGGRGIAVQSLKKWRSGRKCECGNIGNKACCAGCEGLKGSRSRDFRLFLLLKYSSWASYEQPKILNTVRKLGVRDVIDDADTMSALSSGLGTPFFSVLFHAVRYVLFRSKKRTFRSFPFFSRVFGDF